MKIDISTLSILVILTVGVRLPLWIHEIGAQPASEKHPVLNPGPL